MPPEPVIPPPEDPKPDDFRLAKTVWSGCGFLVLGVLLFEGIALGGESFGWVGAFLGPFVIDFGAGLVGVLLFFVLMTVTWKSPPR